jgi:PhnB protein
MISLNLFVPDSEKALRFYEKALGAVAAVRWFDRPIGERAAKFHIGKDRFAIADENSAWGSKSPLTLGGSPMCIQLFVDDVKSVANRSLAAGGKVAAPGTDAHQIFITPDGTECCNVADPFGFIWSISKEKEAGESK